MELKDAAQYIRDTVSMQTILDLYGYQPRHGFMICPFHGDHNSSLKVYPGTGGWHCFGCGRGGSVIDWVMEHDSCNFPTAVKAIDGALQLGLLEPGDPLEESHRRRLNGILDEMEALLLQQISDKKLETEIKLRYLTGQQMQLESIPKRERTAKEWTDLYNLTEEMQWLEYKLTLCDELREEVRTWRREKRRVKAK